jgi:signal transduction histidine kinase
MQPQDFPQADLNAQPELQFAAALAEAAAVVNSSLNFEEVLDRILEQVTRVVPGDTYNIMLVEDGVGRIVRWRGYREQDISEQKVRETITCVTAYYTFKHMMQTGEPEVIGDTETHKAWVRKPQRVDHRAYVGVPIRIDGHTEGFININSSCPNRFTPDDAKRLKAFADHAAVALRNAQLYREVQRYAGELERRVEDRTQALEARTAWSEAVLRSTSDGIIVTDSEGNIIQMNPVAAGWLEQLLQPADAALLRQTVRSIAGRAAERPEELVDLGGLDLELQASPIFEDNPNGNTVVAVHDVSHLRALDRIKSQFISDVSHELRTPIASMLLYTSLLQTGPEDRKASYFASLEQELDRLTQLIEGILHIARIQAGHLELRPQVMDLDLLASTAVNSYAPEAEARGLDMRYRSPGHPLIIQADPAWMIRSVNNLMENALLYTHTGGVEVAATIQDCDGTAYAQLSVTDTGIGIKEEERERLFERFFRGEEARTMQIPGSGLGLAIVKEVVALHGGSIEVESEEGKGSRFTMRLPLAPNTD